MRTSARRLNKSQGASDDGTAKQAGNEDFQERSKPGGFEQKLWAAADKLRGHMHAAEYKHVVLGLIFLHYISDAFQAQYDRLKAEEYAEPEDRDEYTAENVFGFPRLPGGHSFRQMQSSPPSANSLTRP